MIISALFVVDLSSGLIIGLCFLAVWQKGKLARLGGVRGNINKLRAVSFGSPPPPPPRYRYLGRVPFGFCCLALWIEVR